MALSIKFEDNYVELYAYVYGQRIIYDDRLNLLKIEAKSLYVPANKTRALELQTEIQVVQSYLASLDKYVRGLSDKYKEIAMEFNSDDARIFIEMFIDRVPIKTLADKYCLSESRMRVKKVEWTKKIKSKLKNKESIPPYLKGGKPQ